MDKKYQVFVSSTYDDLREERQEVIQALLHCDCIPVGMELFPASDDDQWQFIKDVIDECDYFVVILAGRYGSCAPDGMSFTEREYRYALERKTPTIGFVHSDPGKIVAQKTEREAEPHKKLEAFRELVRRKLCKEWSSPKELGLVVTQSIGNLKKRSPATGWVRADRVASEEAATELLRLRKDNDALRAKLAELAQGPPPGTESLVGGRDTLYVGFRVTRLVQGPDPTTENHSTDWNQVFRLVGPHMLVTASEAELKDALLEGLFRLTEGVDRLAIVDEDFQKIKVQLMALGLTRITGGDTSAGGAGEGCWTLTPYGRAYLMQLMAIKKPQKAKA